MKKNIPYLSIIVPVFNEARRLYHLPEIHQYFARTIPGKFELLVVNDGSVDGTLKCLEDYQKKFKFEIITYSENQGKGYAVRQGMLKAKGEYRLFLDVDLSTHPTEFSQIRNKLNKQEVFIGVRRSFNSKVLVHQSKFRENLGQVFTWLSKTWLNVPVSDFTCGFKIFPAQIAQLVFSYSKINRWGFDSEILFLSRLFGFTIHEFPVTWRNDQNTKVNLYKDVVNSFAELLKIRYFWLIGSYTRTLT